MSQRRNIAAFIRHGDYQQREQTPSAMQPFALSSHGEHEAKDAAVILASFATAYSLHISPTVHCSCLLRAWQTANIVAKNLSSTDHTLALQESPALSERSVGSLANLSATAIEYILKNDPRYPTPPQNWKSNSHYALPYPGAESLMQAGQRVANYIQQVMTSLPQEAGILQIFVGHGAAFRHAACHKGMLAFKDIARLSMFHAKPIYFTAKGDVWQQQAGDWKIRSPSSTYTD